VENEIVSELIQEIQFLRKEVSELKSITLRQNEVVEVAMDFDLRQGITKVLYPTIARKHNSTPSKVERGMRNAIESSWHRSYKPFLNMFGEDRPTNPHFVAVIADRIRLEEKIS
jgi:two-component system, response regulator, stage 0 sporulation protein A